MRYRIINTRTLAPRLKEAFDNDRIGFHDNGYAFAEDRIAFVHVPKTAGTSLHQALEGSGVVNVGMHRPVSLHCPPGRYRYITVLRDPVARVWSYFQMSRSDPTMPWHRVTDDLFTFLTVSWEVQNMAVRYYAGYPHCEANEVMVERAERNLGKFIFVADFAKPETLAEMVKFAGGTRPIGHQRKAAYPTIDADSAELIARFNRADIALYEQFAP